MKTSLVVTVLNEAESITELLQSIKKQTLRPSEVIIVDGGSTDSTVKLIKEFSRQSSLKLRLLVKPSTRSRGRNLGIGEAVGEGIAVTDAGCIPDKHWFANITKALRDKTADVVGGIYRMKTDTFFTHCSAPFFGPMSHNIKRATFLPASRSIAFTKSAWAKVGGYPDSLRFAAEDLVFAQKLKNDPSLTMVLKKSAIVEWTPAQNLPDFFRDIANHTLGNIEAGYLRHLCKNYLVAIRYAVGVPLLLAALISNHPTILTIVAILVLLYFFYPSIKFAGLVRGPRDILGFGLLQLVADAAVITALLTRVK